MRELLQPLLAQEADNGIVGVESIVSDADSAGLLSYNVNDLQKVMCWFMGTTIMLLFMMEKVDITAIAQAGM